MTNYPLTTEIYTNTASRLLEYGVLGIFLILTAYIAFQFYKKIEENSSEWKELGKKMSDNYTNIVIEQNTQNKKLIQIQRETVKQNQYFHKDISAKVDDLPNLITKEIKLLQSTNYTPAPNNKYHKNE